MFARIKWTSEGHIGIFIKFIYLILTTDSKDDTILRKLSRNLFTDANIVSKSTYFQMLEFLYGGRGVLCIGKYNNGLGGGM